VVAAVIALIRDILLAVLIAFRETLPTTDDDCGPFLAGACWMLFVCMLALLIVSYGHLRATGG
jgi:hypothetical protein